MTTRFWRAGGNALRGGANFLADLVGALLSTPALSNYSALGAAPLTLEWSTTDYVVGLYGQLEIATDSGFSSISQNIVFFIDGDSWSRLDESISLLTPSGTYYARIRVCRDNDSGATTVTGFDPLGNAVSFTADVSAWSNIVSDTINVSVAALDPAESESHVVLSGTPKLTATMPITWGPFSGSRATMQQVANDGYWEIDSWAVGTGGNSKVYVCIVDGTFAITNYANVPGANDGMGCCFRNDGTIYHDAGFSSVAGWSAGDVIGIRLNKTTKVVTFYKNGVAQSPTVTLSGCSTFYAAVGVCSDGDTVTANFGGSTFVDLPSGASMYG